MFDSRDFFPPEEISSPEGVETPVESPIPMSPSSSVGKSSHQCLPREHQHLQHHTRLRMSIRTSAEVLLLALEASQLNRQIQNKNTGTSRTPVARKGINDHKRKFDDRRNTTTNNDNNYSNNHNRNNNYHQQQNRRQDKKYHGNLPLCTRCTLHHTGVCTVRCQTCNKVGHRTRNCRSKGPATGSNLLSVSVTCHACGKKGHYKSQC
ncbi:reverse transcriptase domain-containing protein [Tanacetum coccineum]